MVRPPTFPVSNPTSSLPALSLLNVIYFPSCVRQPFANCMSQERALGISTRYVPGLFFFFLIAFVFVFAVLAFVVVVVDVVVAAATVAVEVAVAVAVAADEVE